ncbi:carbohydrate ABC transporter permease [Leifsonia sp. NPDC058194]|uniref:carbohydrate ABC transporter permease n=1 Tax=Leifsonia sp. NPDC058194 TaxID=3346374 RepID=UPI0036DAE2C7
MTTSVSTTLARRPSGAPRKRRRFGSRRAVTGYLFLLPAIALIAVFTLVPFVESIILSFQSWDGVSPDTPWVGVRNYDSAFKNVAFWASMKNVLIFGVVGFVVGNGVSMVMALAVNAIRKGRTVFRTVYYLPSVLSVVVVGMVFSAMLDPRSGIINKMLGWIGLPFLQHDWLNDPNVALLAVIGVFLWLHWGFGFILFLAGLQDIPKYLYEAAELDGARGWAKFRYITWPQLAPVTTVVSLLTLLAALQIFGTVQVLTNGGPGYTTMVPTLQIFTQAFTYNNYGQAAAMSVIFGGALIILSLLQLGFSRRRANG